MPGSGVRDRNADGYALRSVGVRDANTHRYTLRSSGVRNSNPHGDSLYTRRRGLRNTNADTMSRRRRLRFGDAGTDRRANADANRHTGCNLGDAKREKNARLAVASLAFTCVS